MAKEKPLDKVTTTMAIAGLTMTRSTVFRRRYGLVCAVLCALFLETWLSN